MMQSSQASTLQASDDPSQFQGFTRFLRKLSSGDRPNAVFHQIRRQALHRRHPLSRLLKLSSRTLANDLTTNGRRDEQEQVLISLWAKNFNRIINSQARKAWKDIKTD